ncbi:putative pentatricopeptide repeat-containing protein At1g77010, mitochondrial [Lolium rigidum]|uniref:putative pentatricopeptide repeat-containing protein At1g77010, mitochondrial n=1 Tax=Lolium rigidum TaxID=89674 RepID=UPI001F5D8BFF|nr:putative pentatricopeptide repeat-containing protein At1g77010, mitochondrial [Lolium rigidum]
MAVAVDVRGYIQLLRSCSAVAGQQLHQALLKSGHVPSSLPPSNSVLLMYARCSPAHRRDARRLFDEMPGRNCFSYNSLVTAHLNSRDHHAALTLFRSMPERNNFSWNTVITGMVSAGDLDTARALLEEMPVKDAVACNAVLHRYVRSGRMDEAFALVRAIGLECGTAAASPCNDPFVLATVIGACADRMKYDFGRQAHGRMVVAKVELDSVLTCTLVDMYCKCGDLDSARRVFDGLAQIDEFSVSALVYGYASRGQLDEALRIFYRVENLNILLWNSVISGCAFACLGDDAFALFVRMMLSDVLPDSSTFASVLNVCAFSVMLKPGIQIHGCGLKSGTVNDMIAASALIDFYSKCSLWEDACRAFSELRFYDTVVLNSMITVYSNCGRIEEAKRVFYRITSKSVISWNSMVVGLSQNGHAIDAMELFCEMHRLGVRLDKVAIASALSASSNICSISFGEQIFSLATVRGLQCDNVVAASLIDLYCKCGNLASGCKVFDGIDKSDEVLWNSMLIGYASNGHGHKALELLELMKVRGIRPTERTFVGVLSACCHSGLVEEGLTWFKQMQEDFCVSPSAEHYACVTDLLVRAGRLDEAVEFIENMPFKADPISWTTIVSGCKAQGNEALTHKMAKRLTEMGKSESPHSSLYVQLSSVLAAQGDWVKSEEMRGLMRERRIAKKPGYSWIDS